MPDCSIVVQRWVDVREEEKVGEKEEVVGGILWVTITR